MQLLSSFIYARTVVGVNDEDKALGAREVMPPKRSDFVLTTDVPYVKLDILVCNRLNVESDSGNGCDILS